MSMAELKRKFMKFLPRQPLASIQKQSPRSPGGSVAGNRSPSRHAVSIIPKEARRKLRSSSFSAREPSSPKVSCMGDVDQLMKRKRKKKKKRKARKQQGCDEKDVKKKMLLWIFKASSGGDHRRQCDQIISQGESGGKVLEKDRAELHTHGMINVVPSLGTMKKFASGRGALSDFDHKLPQLSAG